MRINTNLSALNGLRHAQANQQSMDLMIQRLSSGLRINGAADDAAGLGISAKLESNVRGTESAMRGLQDGISMLQTAAGGGSTVATHLQRLRELAVQGANDTLTASDRSALQDEITQLGKEIDRVVTDTDFNGVSLMESGTTTAAMMLGSRVIVRNMSHEVQLTTASLTGNSVRVNGTGVTDYGNLTLGAWSTHVGVYNGLSTPAAAVFIANAINNDATSPVSAATSGDQVVLTAKVAGAAGSFSTGSNDSKTGLAAGMNAPGTDYDAGSTDLGAVTINGVTTTFGVVDNNVYITDGALGQYVADTLNATNPSLHASLRHGKIFLESAATGSAATLRVTSVDADSDGDPSNDSPVGLTAGDVETGHDPTTYSLDHGVAMQAGAGAGQAMTLHASAITRTQLGIPGNTMSVATNADATSMISAVDDAIAGVNTFMSQVGAQINRLQHGLTNLGTYSVQLAASESRIRDADVAHAMMGLVQSQIISQSAMAMVASANQRPQSVLSLLR